MEMKTKQTQSAWLSQSPDRQPFQHKLLHWSCFLGGGKTKRKVMEFLPNLILSLSFSLAGFSSSQMCHMSHQIALDEDIEKLTSSSSSSLSAGIRVSLAPQQTIIDVRRAVQHFSLSRLQLPYLSDTEVAPVIQRSIKSFTSLSYWFTFYALGRPLYQETRKKKEEKSVDWLPKYSFSDGELLSHWWGFIETFIRCELVSYYLWMMGL